MSPVVESTGQAGAGGLPPELQKALSRVNEISSLPEITTRIVRVVEDPKSTAQDMHEIVRNDPALAAKILKVVNSAFYGLPSQIASLDRAIVMLGMSAVKNIALAASLSRLFRAGQLSEKFDARDLWTHCMAVGVCARMLAHASHAQAEEIFVAGLVHDLGLLVEYQLFPDQLRQVVETCEKTGENFLEVERRTFGVDHQLFGAALAARWKFPPGLRSAITYHHNPDALKPDMRRFVNFINVADTICCENELGFYLEARHQEVNDVVLGELGLSAGKVAQLLESLPERIEETRRIFAEAE